MSVSATGVLEPALFGGAPRRGSEPLGTAQLAPLDVDRFMPRLAAIRRSGRYVGGDQEAELEATLADFHGVPHAVALANASYGLLFALAYAARGRAGALAMPSYSFRGLPYLARMLGRELLFVDVRAEDGTLDPRALERVLAHEEVAAVMAVHNADAPADIVGLARVAGDAGVPLVYDSVYALWNRVGGAPLGRHGAAEVFSLHATKLLNGFEGGYVCTRDAALAAALRRWREGEGSADDGVPPLRARLVEVHAAAALVALPELAEVVAQNRARFAAYEAALAGAPHLRLVRAPRDVSPHFGTVLVEVLDGSPLTRDELYDLMNAEGYLVRKYYGPALHQMAPWNATPLRASLPVTERLATRFLQLPVGDRVTPKACGEAAVLLREFMSRGPELGARLHARRAGR